jgi:GMP synthase (glutamine-hydrolysing)
MDLCERDLSKSEFVRPISNIVGEGARVKPYKDVEPEEVEAADAVIMCGTALADDEYVDEMDRFEWLRTTETPVLGICAGMQVIAITHGAWLVPGREIGMTPIAPTRANQLIPRPAEVYELHKYDLEGLGEFRVLARSDRCVQAIVHRERPLYGILFHPEVRRGGVVSVFLDLVRRGRL